ncbi:MAG TPA: flagellar filament capping protein FliD [Cellulomonas sp.]|uniref:flagellar filament capping protein FliD n=1 Tax=Cellulomonas sp. TaxID=40001 RepID=UPI002E3809C9|nr:flagellar filament capping protein FliD [Cellulomonas sp.]HEX5332043.1 flagellar filament capping protein FliD [Cellulomonas sp.]
MATMGIDGLISGLDTTTLINQLMTAEAGPQTLLKTKQTAASSLVTALQALNSKVASLAASATTAATASSWNALKATSSAASVSATASTSAQATSLNFTVDAVASRQVSLSDQFTSTTALFPTVPPVITFKKTDGTLTTVTAASGDLADITKAINASGTGVTAVAVKVGTDYRLQFTGSATGASNGFQMYLGSSADVTAGTAPSLALTSTSTAQDAKITLWSGSSAAKQVTSSSNTFADTLAGVSITVSQVEASPVTLTVSQDTSALTTLASNLVSGLGLVLSEISSQTASKTTTSSTGGTVVTGGVLSSESTVRDLAQQIQSAGSYPVDGVSPSTVGISIGRDGTFTFDAAKFTAALAADPAAVQKMMTALSQRIADVAKGASDATTGSLSTDISSQQGTVKSLGDQISSWDVRLATRKEGLQATYSALEVALSGLKSQSSWLTAQLASLGTGTSTTGG